jgi:heat shock protein HslJ
MIYSMYMTHTKRNVVLLLSLLCLALIPFFFLPKPTIAPTDNPPIQTRTTPKNATYLFSGEPITLNAGVFSRQIAPESASQEVFRVFGEPKTSDLDSDGDEDAVLFLTQDTGGSGTFYYVAVAINENGMYRGTNAMYLGDRIAPQTIDIHDGKAVANFAERRSDENFATPPSIGKSVWIHLDTQRFEIGEAVQDFEGETDVLQTPLTKHVWKWVRSEYDGTILTPNKADVFTLTLNTDGSVHIGTDCNGMGGQYTVQGYSLTFSPLMSTLMYCEGSQEGEFSKMLSEVHAFSLSDTGELLLRYQKSGVSTFIKTQQEESGGTRPITPPVEEPVGTLPPQASKQCVVGGCSGQVCSDTHDIATTCEWREEYACYQKAVCERQASGQCAWTETEALNACLSENSVQRY